MPKRPTKPLPAPGDVIPDGDGEYVVPATGWVPPRLRTDAAWVDHQQRFTRGLGMVRRMLKVMTRDVALTADMAMLPELVAVSDEAARLVDDTVLALREAGVSWQEIGESLGMTAQGAQQRFGRRRHARRRPTA